MDKRYKCIFGLVLLLSTICFGAYKTDDIHITDDCNIIDDCNVGGTLTAEQVTSTDDIDATGTVTTTDLIVNTNNIFTISGSNFVGIHTSVPGTPLDIIGTTRINGTLIATSGQFSTTPTITITSTITSDDNTVSFGADEVKTTGEGDFGNLTVDNITVDSDIVSLNATTWLHSPGTANLGLGANGRQALNTSVSGSDNSCVGANAGAAITSGSFNMAFGSEALSKVTTSSYSSAIGTGAVRYNTGQKNLGIGYNALRGWNGKSAGSFNTAIGTLCFVDSNSTATENTGIGNEAGFKTNNGSYNVAIGANAMNFSLEGTYNTIVGRQAGYGVSGNNIYSNSLFGARAGATLRTNATGNSFFGRQAGRLSTTLDYSVFLGYQAGYNLNTDNLLCIDNQDRGLGNEVDESLIYGSFNNTVASQTLNLNAAVRISTSGGTDSSQFETDGTLKFNGAATVWDDIRTPMTSIRITGPGGSTPPDEVLYKGSVVLAFGGAGSDDEKGFFVVQMPHWYKEGSDITPHIHWTPVDNTAGNVRWILTYSWANVNATYPAETTSPIEVACDTTTDKHQLDNFPAISGVGKTISSMILCSIQREDSDANDTYNSKDVYLTEIDFHAEKDTTGSRTISAK